ncbi:MAG TPA: TlpA disulfide reductase family protein [Saprospiraceae bacterium]|nr:TlpA disulfide reductase family protein [Saprospiraceae bacterium]HNT21861.1 TlpA disulfide reductase family protein [Saprospiraceae bacterium]
MLNRRLQTFLAIILGAAILMLARYFYFQPGVKVGEECPPFQTRLADGTAFEMASLKGKYVLIDFWGSWCAPCRKEAPELKKFYESWRQTGFRDGSGLELVSIAIEEDRSNWEKAIREDSATWPVHILELDLFNSSLVKTFQVREIPTKILLDPSHRVVAVNQGFEEMAVLLNSRIQKD